MGIDKLNKYLKDKVPNAYNKKSVYDFENQKIAFDISIVMYKYMSYALKIVVNQTNIIDEDLDRNKIIKIWINGIIKSFFIWLNYKIKPVVIFDGPAGQNKNKTLIARGEGKRLRKEKIALLTSQIRADPLSNCMLINDLKKELMNDITIFPEDKLLLKNVLESIGIPCLTAICEAEQLCAMLCIESYCVGCYSLDSDLLVYGCPLMITKFSDELGEDINGNQEIQIECIMIDVVLRELTMTRDMFVDFCILLGCDYNQNIKNLRVSKAYQLILKYRSIDNIPVNEYIAKHKSIDITCLNHIECREAFKVVEAKTLVFEGDLDHLNIKPYEPTYVEYTKNHAYNIKLYYKNIQ